MNSWHRSRLHVPADCPWQRLLLRRRRQADGHWYSAESPDSGGTGGGQPPSQALCWCVDINTKGIHPHVGVVHLHDYAAVIQTCTQYAEQHTHLHTQGIYMQNMVHLHLYGQHRSRRTCRDASNMYSNIMHFNFYSQCRSIYRHIMVHININKIYNGLRLLLLLIVTDWTGQMMNTDVFGQEKPN